MQWETYADKDRQVRAITDEAKNADTLILATDPDREGEAISWHVQELLAKKALPKKVERVTFNAITKSGGDRGDEAAARARRGSDRRLPGAAGARLSGRLHAVANTCRRKLPGAKSAGRVQSVALRLIVDRERDIEIFKAQEYWSVSGPA